MRRKYREAEAEFNAKGYGKLAMFNSERARGILHTEEYVIQMASLQAQFNSEQIAEAHEKGWIVV